MKKLVIILIGVAIMTTVAAFSEEGKFSWDPLFVEKLANGLTVIVKEDRTAPLAVTDVWFKVGSRNETDANNGVAHFLEHTLFKGTKTRGVGQIAKDIEAFGGRTNAGTSMDFTHYYISCESQNIMKALEIHADVFRSSTLLEESIDKERGVILEEIKRGEDNPQKVLWDTLISNSFPSHPYGRLTLGPRENISKNIKRDDLVRFFKTWYVPSNMTVIVAGDVDQKAIIDKVKSLYEDLPLASVPKAEFPPEPELKAPKIIRKEMEVNRSYLFTAFRTVRQSLIEDAVGLDLLGMILGQGRSSRLSMALKENRGIVTSIGGGQFSMADDGLFLIRAEFDPSDEDEVWKGIREEILKLRRDIVSPEELQKAKDFLENLYLRGIESNEGKADSLGSSIVKADLELEKQYLDKMRAVTASQIQVLANKYLSFEGAISVVVGPKPRYKEAGEFNGTAKFVFDNGLRIIHRHLPGTGLVGVSLAVDAGNRREPAGKTGVSNLTSEMLLKGTKKRDGQKILWDLEALGAELAPSPEPDLLRFNMGVSSRNYSKAFDILADAVRNPTFPEDALKIEKSKVLMRLKAVGDDMFENTWQLFSQTLYPDHPYSIYPLGTKKDVEKLTTTDLKDFHEKAFNPGNMVLAIVGDVTASEAIKVAHLYFGEMPPAPPWKTDGAFAAPQKPTAFKKVEDKKKKTQAMVCLGWLGPSIGHPDYAPMKVLNAILGGGMSARYFMNIRNKASLAYAASGVFPSRIDGGALCAVIGTDPNSVEKVKELVFADVDDITKNGVGKEEFDRAVSFVSGQFALDHATCLRYAHYLSWFESIGVGYEYDGKYPPEVKQVKPEDLQRVASTYLSPAHALMAVTGP